MGATDTSELYLRKAALAGLATGLRSTVGVVALIESGSPAVASLLTQPVPRVLARLVVAAEFVMDKLPAMHSRLEPGPLAGRAVFAGTSGAILARGADRPVLPAVIVGSAAALASARVGHDARVAASQRWCPLVVAAIEDALALILARAAARPGRDRQ